MNENLEIKELITLRIEQANETIKEVGVLIENHLYRVAISRIYYGMFYMLLALSLKNNFKTSKHAQLIGWFNKTFIKKGILNKKYGNIIHNAFEERSDSDYGVFVEFARDEVDKRYSEMKDFIITIENFLNK
ncbi:MAG: HEPN domain-containing protein [Bacteroidales bacterium]